MARHDEEGRVNIPSSTLFHNGLIYSGAGTFVPGWLLMRGGRIAAVSSRADDMPRADKTIDLEHGSLLPGLIDAHVHPLMGGIQLMGVDLLPVHSAEGYTEILRKFAEQHNDSSVLVGGGWFGDIFTGGFPTASFLDDIEPRRPVILYSHDAHGVWINSVALKQSGITNATPDPPDGIILRYGNGDPTGVLLDGAVSLIQQLLPQRDPDFLDNALSHAQDALFAKGITAWQDAAVGVSDLGPDVLPSYRSLERQGTLRAHVAAALWWDRAQGLEQLDELMTRSKSLAECPHVSARTVKVMLDGNIENRSASMLEPLFGHPESGELSFIEPEDVKRLTARLDSLDFQIHFHAVGDAATRSALDAIEYAITRNGQRDNRHHIAHLDIVDTSDFARFHQLSATANVTGLWARLDKEIEERKLPLLGHTRSKLHFPYGSLAAAGARVVGGSDWPVSDANPLWSMYTAMHRIGLREDPHAIGAHVFDCPLLIDERLSRADAFEAYLSNASYINYMEAERGKLQAGYAADLAWFDLDLRDDDNLGPAIVKGTWIDGVRVYSG